MRTNAFIAALLMLGLVASCRPSGKKPGPKSDGPAICPQDKCFCGTESCPTSKDGTCRACGKPPVPVDAVVLKWFWCAEHGSWHETPCDLDSSKDCCAEKTAQAVLVDKGTRTLKVAFCPACGKICDADCPTDDAGNCKACEKPSVEADAVVRTWNWCQFHGKWHDDPCSKNASESCCVEHKVMVLAKPR